jgi:hypothetical protein
LIEEVLNMTRNAKVILSAVGIAAALASPAMARTHVRTAPPAPHGAPVQTVYAPDVPVSPHGTSINPDFQLGSERN